MQTSNEEAVSNLLPFVGYGKYRLGGGAHIKQASPFDEYDSCDCIAAVLWAFGQPRHDPDFPEYEGDINVDSALMDAGLLPEGKGKRKYFTPVVGPADTKVGDILMFPSIRANELGETGTSRLRIGHTGIISKIPPNWGGTIQELYVIECSYGTPAIKQGKDKNFNMYNNRKITQWKNRTYASDKWQTRIVRYTGPNARM